MGVWEILPNEREAIAKAFELKEFSSKPFQVAITALYSSPVTQDLYAAEWNYQGSAELYPKSPQAWKPQIPSAGSGQALRLRLARKAR
jgi:hypothetical protein